MGAVTASRSPSGLAAGFPTIRYPLRRRPCFLAFKTDDRRNSSFTTTENTITAPVDSSIEDSQRGLKGTKKKVNKVKAVTLDEAPSSTQELDFDTVAAALESIYKLSPDESSNMEDPGHGLPKHHQRIDVVDIVDDEITHMQFTNVVRSQRKNHGRLSLDKRMALRKNNLQRIGDDSTVHNVNRLIKDYSVSTDLVGLNWKNMKIPPVLSSSEHAWLFKLMQPMKAILEVKENLHIDLERKPTDGELATALNINLSELKRKVEVGRAARSKLIKHNLRLVLFVINKHFQDLANGSKFQDLCQAGVRGLITSIDKFEQKRGFRLSTYSLFWIRHSITRSMTVSSFMRVPFGIESIRQQIQKAKLELMFELKRPPKEEEIIARVGLSSKRYHDVMKASKQVLSLHSRHMVTREEFIKGITDVEGVGSEKSQQPAFLRLALDDVLDSLKPKESMVIRQRYGLDGKGHRTLGEIAGNLNISREMVRKHEVKALMKLKHPARVDYLRRHITSECRLS